MRFFLCGFNDFLLGVPVSAVSSLMTFSREAREPVEREGGDVFYSLPRYFGVRDQETRHGIILKPLFSGVLQITDERSGPAVLPEAAQEAAPEAAGRNVLLVTAVDREADIAREDLYPLPKLLAGEDRRGNNDPGVSIFTGICFTGAAMVVCIDPGLTVLRMLKSGNVPGEAG
jgi:hypothetical protein